MSARISSLPPLAIRGRHFNWGTRTYIMGIINVTPDSFSGDGLAPSGYSPVEAALEQGRRFVNAGADILDVGGESTRPNAEPVGEAEELRRVIPVIQALADQLDTLISVDTYHSQVADAALQVGASILNDVWALRADPELAQVAAHYQAPVILMHNRASWAPEGVRKNLGDFPFGQPYQDLLSDVTRELLESVALARSAGIPDERIVLDPGIGFGKTVSENLELIRRLGEIRQLGFPVLLGPSRKSFIGRTLDLPPEQRVEGTAAAIAIGIDRGADIVRVHDVEAMVRVARMADALVRSN